MKSLLLHIYILIGKYNLIIFGRLIIMHRSMIIYSHWITFLVFLEPWLSSIQTHRSSVLTLCIQSSSYETHWRKYQPHHTPDNSYSFQYELSCFWDPNQSKCCVCLYALKNKNYSNILHTEDICFYYFAICKPGRWILTELKEFQCFKE